MDTEGRLERYRGADCWTTDESLAAMLDSQMAAYYAVRQSLSALNVAVNAACARLAQGRGRIVYAGAGASARLAVQDGVELMPTFGWPHERIDYLIAGGNEALVRSIEGAEDNGDAGQDAVIKSDIGSNDVFIGVAASGRTPYTIRAIKTARERGALTVALANNSKTALLEAAEHPIPLITGSEFLAGSTRMIAGTAQKIALNLLSTQVMIGLGHVHDGLMVDVVPTNEKLKQRCVQIVQMIADCTKSQAQKALERSDGDIKIAVLQLDGLTYEQAKEQLHENRGFLRHARNQKVK